MRAKHGRQNGECTCEGANRLDRNMQQSLKQQARGMSHDLLALARRVAREHPGEYAHLVIAADVLCRICRADLTLECPRCTGNAHAKAPLYVIPESKKTRPIPPRLPSPQQKTEPAARKPSQSSQDRAPDNR